jgi:hypothetical protein
VLSEGSQKAARTHTRSVNMCLNTHKTTREVATRSSLGETHGGAFIVTSRVVVVVTCFVPAS